MENVDIYNDTTGDFIEYKPVVYLYNKDIVIEVVQIIGDFPEKISIEIFGKYKNYINSSYKKKKAILISKQLHKLYSFSEINYIINHNINITDILNILAPEKYKNMP